MFSLILWLPFNRFAQIVQITGCVCVLKSPQHYCKLHGAMPISHKNQVRLLERGACPGTDKEQIAELWQKPLAGSKALAIFFFSDMLHSFLCHVQGFQQEHKSHIPWQICLSSRPSTSLTVGPQPTPKAAEDGMIGGKADCVCVHTLTCITYVLNLQGTVIYPPRLKTLHHKRSWRVLSPLAKFSWWLSQRLSYVFPSPSHTPLVNPAPLTTQAPYSEAGHYSWTQLF